MAPTSDHTSERWCPRQLMHMLWPSEIEESTMPTSQSALFRRVVRQAQVIADAAGAPACAPALALELFTSLCWLEPSDQARRVALIDELMRRPTPPSEATTRIEVARSRQPLRRRVANPFAPKAASISR